jgi:hypothetical protein
MRAVLICFHETKERIHPHMILEDLQYRNEGLKPRIAMVRSYL